MTDSNSITSCSKDSNNVTSYTEDSNSRISYSEIGKNDFISDINWDISKSIKKENKLWTRYYDKIYIRNLIFCNNKIEIENTKTFSITDKNIDEFITDSVYFDKNKDLLFKLYDDNNINDNYINKEIINYFEILLKNIKYLQYQNSNFILLLDNIYNICQVIALDLNNKYIIILHNKIFYIIFYNEHVYICLKIENNNYDDYDKKKLFL